MQYLAYIIFRIVVNLFAILPFGLLYRLSDLLKFLLHRVIRYRYKVIEQNLKNAFPKWKQEKRKHVIDQCYSNLCDILLESIKGLSLSPSELKARYQYLNPELIQQPLDQYQSILLAGAHLTNWEWGVRSIGLQIPERATGIYKTLSNPFINTFLKEKRKKWGLTLIPMEKAGRTILRQKNKTQAYVFFSDQTPSNTQRAHWIDFLNQPTPFHSGLDKIYRTSKYPIFTFDIVRVNRGYYEVTFSPLEIEKSDKNNVTQKYAGWLERNIKKQPGDWLWSHRRWKHQIPEDIGTIPIR